MKNYYNVLHIPQDASVAEIEKAYKKLARQYDPNRAKGDKYAEERFIDVSLAYKTLADSEKREDYDRILKSIVKGAVSEQGAKASVSVVQSKISFRWVAVMTVLIVVVCGTYWIFTNGQKNTQFLSGIDTAVNKPQHKQVQTATPIQDTVKEVVAHVIETPTNNKSIAAVKDIFKEGAIKKKEMQPLSVVAKEKEESVLQPAEAVQDSYAIGASKSTILNIQGTPTAIAKYNAGTDVWFYGKSELHISKGKLMVAKNIDGNLKVK